MMGGVSDEAKAVARAHRAWDRVAAEGGIVSRGEIAQRLGVTVQAVQHMSARESFPAPVAKVGRLDLWLWPDVVAYRAVRQAPGRPTNEALGRA